LAKKIKIFLKIILSPLGWAFSQKKKRGAYEWVATKIDPTYGKCGPFLKYTNNKT
jgi:hypothetical protein